MDELDRDNLLVLTVFEGSVVTLTVGYIVAWRSKRKAYRKAGALMTAAITGFAGLFMLAWLIDAIMPLPPPNGSRFGNPCLSF